MHDPLVSRRAVLKGLAGGGAALLAGSLPLTACREPPAPPGPGLKALSAREHLTIERVAARVMPGGAGGAPAAAYGMGRQADALLPRLSRTMQDQFHQLLYVFERLPVLAGKWRAFSDQDDGGADEYLRAWRHAPVGFMRQGADGLLRLVKGIYYADPRSWPALGYDGVWVGARDMGYGIDNQGWGPLVNPHVYRTFEG